MMKNPDAWEQFCKTGGVYDYLRYRGAGRGKNPAKEAVPGEAYSRWSDRQGKEYKG